MSTLREDAQSVLNFGTDWLRCGAEVDSLTGHGYRGIRRILKESSWLVQFLPMVAVSNPRNA